jgi:signal transduction histidine kinase/CheY-like chemotaxis protein
MSAALPPNPPSPGREPTDWFAFLAAAGEALSASLDYEQTLRDVARLAVPALGDLCIVDVLEGGRLRRVTSAHAVPEKAGLLDTLRRLYTPAPDSPQPAARVIRSGLPELLPEVTPGILADHALNPDHAALIRAIGMRSHLAVPLTARGATLGVLSLGITESDRRYGPADLALAEDLARRAALAVDNARLYRAAQAELAERRRAEDATQLLADAGETLGASLDYHATLADLARLVVPRVADWCAVDLLTEAGTLERVAVAHPDPARVELANELFRRYPPRPDDPFGPWRVLAAGEPEWTAEVTDDTLRSFARDPGHARLIRGLNVRSYVCVPLTAHGTRIGVLSLVLAESGRKYGPADVTLATDLARRAAAAVDNARLYERLRAEDRRKDEFLATLAHELRNPLAPIRMGLHILRLDKSGEAAERTREMMDRQLAHMVRLIDDLLDLSRVTRGTVRLERELVDLAAVVGTAVEAGRPLLDAAGHGLAVELPPGPVLLDADRTRLAQVFANLLNNAAKYTDRGGRIGLAARRDGGEVEVRVTDTGVGIPREMLGRVFEMFTQVGRSVDRSQGGLGIGLTLVRRLVELHGGRVWAESGGPGAGSTFVVRLPLSEVGDRGRGGQGEEKGEDRRSVFSPPPAVPLSPSRKVLVVDDTPDAAASLAEVLRLRGHEVRVAGGGSAALEVVREFRPDVAFLDIGMPGMSGYELAGRLRGDLGGVVLVAVTGWGQDEDRRRAKEAGFDHHLTKPADPKDVQAVLERAGG